jgi:tellurite resistance protein TerC
MATPLFLALILVETSDVAFAIDSIPAIFAITRDPFIVFTSNIFAILGLRSMYFVLAGLMEKFRYLKISLAFLLGFIGVKMILIHHYPIDNAISLAVIAGILTVGILASLKSVQDSAALLSPLADEIEHLIRVSYQQAKKAVILFSSCAVLLVTVLILVLPEPSAIIWLLGTAILVATFVLARRWLRKVSDANAEE